jgi:hypothetical protein
MGIYRPKNTVLNWYQYDIGLSLELIESFVDGIEEQVNNSVALFEGKKGSYTTEEYSGEDFFMRKNFIKV